MARFLSTAAASRRVSIYKKSAGSSQVGWPMATQVFRDVVAVLFTRLYLGLRMQRSYSITSTRFSSPEGEDKVKIEISSNAGRYLCEFIYYSSLSIDNSRCLFVHVPDLNVADGKTLGAALKLVVDLLVKQIRAREMEQYRGERQQPTMM